MLPRKGPNSLFHMSQLVTRRYFEMIASHADDDKNSHNTNRHKCEALKMDTKGENTIKVNNRDDHLI